MTLARSRIATLALIVGLAPGAALGIGRFAYGLVLPSMQSALGLSYAEAGLLGSANTVGYLLGALVSHRLLYGTGYRLGVAAALLLQTLLIAGLGITESFALLFAARLAQGVLGALVFVGGAALMLASGGRGLALGLYFSGVGTGIIASPIALALADSWQQMWLWLGALSGGMSLATLAALPGLAEPAPPQNAAEGSLSPIALLLVSYGLYGAGYIGYMTFITGLLSVSLAPVWLILGLGAMFTGLLWGRLSDQIGGARALRYVLATLTFASLYPLLATLPWLSALLFGLSFLGVITAITEVFRQRLPERAWPRAMGLSTAAFALGQALGPTLSGLAGDLFGGTATLHTASALLAGAFALAGIGQRQSARQAAERFR